MTSRALATARHRRIPALAGHWSVIGKFSRSKLPPSSLADTQGASTQRTFRGSVVKDVNLPATPRYLLRHEAMSDEPIVYEAREDDEETTWSREDEDFLNILKEGVCRLPDGQLQLPLPMNPLHGPLPDNEAPIYYRNKAVTDRLLRNSEALEQARAAFQQYLDLGHLKKVIPSAAEDLLRLFLPLVLVKHARKGTIRITFDGAARFEGHSLNGLLCTGSDLNNYLRAVLLRMRQHPVAFALDLKHMFNCFSVPEHGRALLRFHWWDSNDPSKTLVTYESCVHLFGARSSPGVAMFALKVIANLGRTTDALTSA